MIAMRAVLPLPSASWPRKHPLLLLGIASVVGIISADRMAGSLPGFWLPALMALWLAIWRMAGFWSSLPALALMYGGIHAQRLQQERENPVRLLLAQSQTGSLEVTVRGQLYPWMRGAELDEKAALCRLDSWQPPLTEAYHQASAWIKVRLPDGRPLDAPGLYEMKGLLALPRAPHNPGQFDASNHARRMGWTAQLQARDVRLVQSEPWSLRYHFLQAAESCRRWITRQLSLGLEGEGRHAGIILAMTLGASDAAGEDIEDAFRDSGTLHVFAVSGLHVMMLGMLATFVFRSLGPQRCALAVIGVIVAYAYITGWRPSAVRAAFMMAMVQSAPLFNRQAQPANSLGAAALVLLACDTHQLFLPGFQLSFGVVLAIVLLGSLLNERMRPWCELDPFLPPSLATRRQRYGLKLRAQAAGGLSTSFSAWSGSLPLMLLHFSTLTPVAIISNILLVPASTFCLFTACVSLILSACQMSFLAAGVNRMNAKCAAAIVTMAEGFSRLPYGTQAVNLKPHRAASAELRVLHLPFGGGAGGLRCGEDWWLLDTGNENAWRQFVRPWLSHEGVNRLQGIFLSHGDISHTGAASRVLTHTGWPVIHTSLLEPWPRDPVSASLRQLAIRLPPGSPHWQQHAAGELIPLLSTPGFSCRVQVLYPTAEDRHERANDRGMVLRLEIGPYGVLWLNDAGFITEKTLLERDLPLHCDVLVRHQHDSDFSGLTELLHTARPRVVISSNDLWRPEESLPARLREFCSARGIALFDLEADGSVALGFHPNEVEISTHLSKRSLKLPLENP